MSELAENLEVKKLLGRKIAYLRKGAGWSQSRLAERLEVSDNFIGQIERGERAPSMTTLDALARVFNVTVKDLFDFEDHEARQKMDGRDKQLEELMLFLRARSDKEVSFICDMIKSLCMDFKDK
jgi:transcriptional regulator with XRE-family HTH domain